MYHQWHSQTHRLKTHKERQEETNRNPKRKESINQAFSLWELNKHQKKKKMEKKKKNHVAQLSGYVLYSVPTKNMHSSQVLQRQLQKMTNLSHKEKSPKETLFQS